MDDEKLSTIHLRARTVISSLADISPTEAIAVLRIAAESVLMMENVKVESTQNDAKGLIARSMAGMLGLESGISPGIVMQMMPSPEQVASIGLPRVSGQSSTNRKLVEDALRED